MITNESKDEAKKETLILEDEYVHAIHISLDEIEIHGENAVLFTGIATQIEYMLKERGIKEKEILDIRHKAISAHDKYIESNIKQEVY